jgi:hypothetical protein
MILFNLPQRIETLHDKLLVIIKGPKLLSCFFPNYKNGPDQGI